MNGWFLHDSKTLLEFTHRVRGAGGTLYSTTRDPNWTKISRQILINKFEKVCKLFEQATILQIAHFLNHVTPDPGGDLPSEVSKKTLLSVLASKMIPVWSHVTPDPDCDLPSRGVQKRAPPKRTLLGVPVFGPVLPRSSCNLPQNMVPGPKSTFGTHVPDFQVTIYHLEGSHFNIFSFGVIFGTPSDGKS